MMRDQIGSRRGVECPCFRRQSVAGYIFKVLRRYDLEKIGFRISCCIGGLSGCLFDGLDILLLFRR